MPGPLQFETPTALGYFATLVAEDASLSLTEAAVAIAQDDFPNLDAQAVMAEMDAMAVRLKQRFPADAVPVQRLRFLNRFFFQELGFAGNLNHFHDPNNSYVHAVLESRRGIPITLAVIYIELATQIGLVARGVSFPGYFLVKLRMQAGQHQGEVVIDPFTGQSLSRDELDERLAPYRRNRGLIGDFEMPLSLFLQAASARETLARMLRNLKEIHRTAGDLTRQLRVLHRLVVLLPKAWDERRDRGLLEAELGLEAEAAVDLEGYLAHAPDAPDRALVSDRLAALRPGRRSRRH
jgi:regulator of sirC expression with transglutaminase-like and TPR domain